MGGGGSGDRSGGGGSLSFEKKPFFQPHDQMVGLNLLKSVENVSAGV